MTQKTAQKIHFVTLGCEKNLVDSEVMMGIVQGKEYTIVDNAEDADVVVVNTCGFIDEAKAESVETILQMAQLKESAHVKSVLVAGCMAQRYKDELMTEIPEIDGIVGTQDFIQITDLIEESLTGSRPQYFSAGNPIYLYDENTPRVHTSGNISAYLKIAEGCNHACTFCIIPTMRGKLRSRTIESIVTEAEQLVAQGVKEIILIAQDTTDYGVDVYKKRRLADLLEALNNVEGLHWIRLHYAYPGFFTDEVIDAIARLDRVAKYIDMPLQHSEDHILKAMQRPGHQAGVRKLVQKIRDRVPNVALRTSIIVGFPGETDEDFENLCGFVRDLQFDHVGVFTYSPEEGTPSAQFEAQVPVETKERRSNILMEVAREVASQRQARHVGEVLDVLIEKFDEEDPSIRVGRTQFDARDIDGLVFVANSDAAIGDMIKVRVTHAFDFDLSGEAV
ncbi:30S ribosomal protein S12 methylthiotransferase RimO [Tumebacillus permanentifrigoris]|uniref:Ribosomal protein uS12 methylthiotransferase RimO n=1 Tax=Tumebacillus permanentifrigoris TaxID=378543 RepID=A0A316DY97_9BACL|nr:30S ribosomal protein S12 methylthiotransferase RimO [Tumebacillus permanentifrigoris]PWK15490.1 ribosomal protein S12 methylthiotransferase [Tumebacillus permanentifrigoris]